MARMKKHIEYIKNKMHLLDINSISVHTGKLNPGQIAELKNHFNLKKEPFGYTNFTKITKQ